MSAFITPVILAVLLGMAIALMRVPVKYNLGNLNARRVSTALSVLGIGVVIAVMISMMALYNGVLSALVSTGSKDNIKIMREGAEAELSSWVTTDAYHVIRTLPGIAKDANNEPIVSPELVILFKLPKKDDPKGSNVTVRGVTPMAFTLRPYVKLVDGRMFRPGVNELIVSRRISDRFVNCNIGDSFVFGPQTWTVVGLFEAAGTAYDSEIWCDAGYLGQARKRDGYATVTAKAADRSAFTTLVATIKNDNRIHLDAKSEYQYFDEQTRSLNGVKFLVGIVTFFMTLGAIFGTMNTMFTAIAGRTRELATLRALGFRRRSVLMSVVIESAFIALLGGVVGILLSLPVNAISTGTTNFVTFSEVAFNFKVDGGVALRALTLALISGVIGGLLPAFRAARIPITTALREI